MAISQKHQINTFRLFFALWPDEAVRQKLFSASDHLKKIIQGHQVASYNLHMTLHFIGNVSQETFDCLRHEAESVSFKPFSLTIDQVGGFTGPKVAWLGCSEIPQALNALQQSLGKSLLPCGYIPEARVYRPHVSLFRKAIVDDLTPLAKPVEWKVEQFALVLSSQVNGRLQYQPIAFYC